MCRLLVCAVAIALSFSIGRADSVPADEQAFLDKHLSDIVVVAPRRLNDAAVIKCFSAPIYELTITTQLGEGGTGSEKQTAARDGDKLVPACRPGSDGDCPAILKMINPEFKLMTDDDAKLMQAALDAIYPPVTDDEKKAITFHHSGHEWTFIRGNFFDKHMGFVLTTDDKGTVTGVKYALKLS